MTDDPVDRWEPCPVEVIGTGGPERIYDDDPKPDLPRRRVGFSPPETEPLLWDGDDS